MINQYGQYQIELIGSIGTLPGQVSAALFIDRLRIAEAMSNDIAIRVHTLGGDVAEGIAIFTALKNSPATTTIYIDGVAASMGAYIVMAGSQIKMSRFARFMTHCVSGAVSGQEDALRRAADVFKGYNDTFAQMIAERTGITPQQAKAIYLQPNVDKWMTAQQALEAGLVDEIYDGPAQELLANLNNNVVCAELDQRICAALSAPGEKIKFNDMDMKILAEACGLTGSVSEAQIVATVQGLRTTAEAASARAAKAEADLQTLQSEHGKISAELDQMRAKAAADLAKALESFNVELAEGARSGLISAAAKTEFEAIAKIDLPRAQSLFSTLAPRQRITAALKGKADERFTEKTWKELDQEDLLAEFKEHDIEAFKALYKAEFGKEYKE